MMNDTSKAMRRIWAAAIPVVLFFVVAAGYFAPQFAGGQLPQHDVMQYRGMTRDIEINRETYGEDPQWTGRMFGGMPAYLINVAYPAQIVKSTVGRIVKTIDTPAGFLFFAMLAFWLMLLVTGVDPWIGTVPALAYGLSTYFILIIGAGHITKMWALVYAPLMMGGAWVTLRRNMWAGGALTALAASLEIGANHPQITYYFLLTMALFWISEAVAALRGARMRDFARRTAVLAAAGSLAVLSNFSPLWYTMQHTPETIRGGSELTAADEGPKGGLDIDYATDWSYGVAESWNMLIPGFMGGDSSTAFAGDGAVAEALEPYGLAQMAAQLPAYWGDQPYTAGPTYLGAVAILLAALGIGFARGRDLWWIVAASVLCLMLAWGRNFMWLTELAFRILPGYDKFRTVSMTLVVVQWAVPLLGAMALTALARRGEAAADESRARRDRRVLAWATGIVGGCCLLFAVAGGVLLDFGRDAEAELMTEQFHRMFTQAGLKDALSQGMDGILGAETADAMAAERFAILRADALRSLLFVLLAAGVVALYLWRKVSVKVMVAALGVLLAADLWTVDRRYLGSDDFTTARTRRTAPTAADRKILEDKTPGFRVLNLTVSPFNDATTSLHHRSVGGYHGAKLARYQDLITHYLSRMDPEVLDMLNTRYLILSPDSVQLRQSANGAAWLVEGIVEAATPGEEIERLGQIDTRRTAVVARPFEVRSAEFGQGTVTLEEYRPNYLRYRVTADAPALAVFSEIYYDKGWTAYIDGAEAPYIRADYVLRAMELPAGEHVVEWRFRAPRWGLVEGVTLTASAAILAACIALCIFVLRKRKTDHGQQ